MPRNYSYPYCHRVFTVLSVCLLALVSVVTPAYAKEVLLSEVLKENFKGVVIVMEGDSFIDDDTIAGIVRGNKTTTEKLEQVSSLGDYSLQRYENGYLLSKKYTDGKEIPCTTDLELLDFSKKAKKTVELFIRAGVSEREGVQRIASLLSQEQLQKAKDDILPVATMNEAQKNSITDLIYHMYFSGLRQLGVPAGTMLQADQALVCIDTLGNSEKLLCYREPPEKQSKWAFGSISTPAAAPYAEHKRRNISFFGSNIASVTKALSERSDDISYSSSPILAEKPVTVVNPGKAQPGDIMKMIARLYNLRVVTEGKVKKIDVKNTAITQDAHLAKYLASIAPPSLLRAYSRHNLGELAQDILKQVTRELTRKKSSEVPYKALDSLSKNSILVQMVDRALMELRDAQSYIPEYMRNIEVMGIKYGPAGDSSFASNRYNATTFTFMRNTEKGWTKGPSIQMIDRSKKVDS